jgi:hypothetical protein
MRKFAFLLMILMVLLLVVPVFAGHCAAKNPILTSAYHIEPNGPTKMSFPVGNNIYLADGYNDVLSKWDITNPAKPVKLGQYSDGAILLVCDGIQATSNFAYSSVVATICVSDVTGNNPVPISSTNFLASGKLSSVGETHLIYPYLWLTNQITAAGGLVGFDVTDPNNLVKTSDYNDVNLANTTILAVSSDNQYAYQVGCTGSTKGGWTGGTLVLSKLTDAYNIQKVGQYRDPTPGQYWKGKGDVAVSGNYVYTCDGTNNRLIVLNVTDPCNPSLATYLGNVFFSGTSTPFGIAISGKLAYVGCPSTSRLVVVDISNPLHPIVVGVITDTIRLNSSSQIKTVNGYVYVAWHQTGATAAGGLTVYKEPNFTDRRQRQ